jgi:transposase
MHAQNCCTIPEETRRVAQAAFPKGNMYLKLRDELGPVYQDDQFASLFSARGRSAISPGILAMVCVFQVIENLSDRQAADAVRSRIDWKYALGLELDDGGFDFSVLSEFRGRLLQGGEEMKLLDALLAEFQEKNLLKVGGKQRTDSTHVLAAIRNLNRLELAGETLRAALNALSDAAPDWVRETALEDWYERYKMRFDRYRWPKTEAKQEEMALTIGEDGYVLLDAVYKSDAPPEVKNHPMADILRRVWIQQYCIEDGKVQWRKLKSMPTADHLIQSPYDPEARFSRKRDTAWTGYKVHVTETCDTVLHVVTNVETTPATKPDIGATRLVHKALEGKGLLPDQHLVDSGYVDADLVVRSRVDFGVDLVGPAPCDSSWQARTGNGFDLASFHINWDQKTVECPQGAVSHVWSESHDSFSNPVIHIRFSKRDCQTCSARAQCTRSKKNPRSLQLRKQAEHEALQNARQRQETKEFKDIYALRAGVEGTLSQQIRACGMRCTRYIGQTKTHLHNILTAVAVNVTRFADYLDHIPHAATRTSSFASLSVAA